MQISVIEIHIYRNAYICIWKTNISLFDHNIIRSAFQLEISAFHTQKTTTDIFLSIRDISNQVDHKIVYNAGTMSSVVGRSCSSMSLWTRRSDCGYLPGDTCLLRERHLEVRSPFTTFWSVWQTGKPFVSQFTACLSTCILFIDSELLFVQFSWNNSFSHW